MKQTPRVNLANERVLNQLVFFSDYSTRSRGRVYALRTRVVHLFFFSSSSLVCRCIGQEQQGAINGGEGTKPYNSVGREEE